MTIGKRIGEALDKWAAKDADAALIAVSIAIDATAQKAYGKGGRGSYKQFIRDNMPLITRVAFGGSVAGAINLNVPAEYRAKCPDMKADANGLCGLEEIFYHVVRCGLLHEGVLPANLNVHFKSTGEFNVQPDLLEVPASLIFGFAVAVVGAPANVGERIEERFAFNLNGMCVPFNRLWGKKDQLWNLYEAVHAIWHD